MNSRTLTPDQFFAEIDRVSKDSNDELARLAYNAFCNNPPSSDVDVPADTRDAWVRVARAVANHVVANSDRDAEERRSIAKQSWTDVSQ